MNLDPKVKNVFYILGVIVALYLAFKVIKIVAGFVLGLLAITTGLAFVILSSILPFVIAVLLVMWGAKLIFHK